AGRGWLARPLKSGAAAADPQRSRAIRYRRPPGRDERPADFRHRPGRRDTRCLRERPGARTLARAYIRPARIPMPGPDYDAAVGSCLFSWCVTSRLRRGIERRCAVTWRLDAALIVIVAAFAAAPDLEQAQHHHEKRGHEEDRQEGA